MVELIICLVVLILIWMLRVAIGYLIGSLSWWGMAIPPMECMELGGWWTFFAVVSAGIALFTTLLVLGKVGIEDYDASRRARFFDAVVLAALLTLCRVVVTLSGGGAVIYVTVPVYYAIALWTWWKFQKRLLGVAILVPLLVLAYIFSPKVIDWYAGVQSAREEQRVQREEAAEAESLRRQKEAEAESLRRQKEAKDSDNFEKLKTFALNHAPAIWETYQKLGSEIDIQIERNAKLRDTMAIFGRDAGSDKDYIACEAWVEEMRKTRGELLKRLEEAYFAKRKADATPGQADVEALWKKAQEDGIQEAEAAERRFREMTEQK